MRTMAKYPVAHWFTHQLLNQQLSLTLAATPWPEPSGEPVALYLHVPFCESLCTYCSFHRQLYDADLTRQYFAALREQIRLVASQGWQVSQVYIGGGTPTIVPEELIKTVALCEQSFAPSAISVETNPNHLQVDFLKQLKAAGVNRVSVGVQSFDDQLLIKMNRQPYGLSGSIIRALELGAEIIDTFNVDMIFNLPGQTAASLQHDIDILNQLNVGQISWYPLMSDASVAERIEGSLGLYHRSAEYRFYQQVLNGLGEQYTTSTSWCFNRKATRLHDEYVVNNDQYLGLGSGTFSYVGQQLLASTFSIPDYIKAVQARQSPLVAYQRFSNIQAESYRLLMRLHANRLNEPAPFETRHQHSFQMKALQLMRAVEKYQGEWRLTRRGQYLTLMFMKAFYMAVNQFRVELSEAAEKQRQIPLTRLDA